MRESEVISALGDLHTTQSPAEIIDWTLNDLGSRFGCDFCVWTQFNSEGEMRGATLGRSVSPDVWRYGIVMEENLRREHPVLRRYLSRHTSAESGKVTDFVSQRWMDSTILYQEGYRHFGMRRQLSAIFTGPDGGISTYSFGRDGSDYTEEQSGALGILTLHVQLALYKAWQIEALREEVDASRTPVFRAIRILGGWVFTLARDEGIDLIKEHFGDGTQPYTVPRKLAAHLDAALTPLRHRSASPFTCNLGKIWTLSARRLKKNEVEALLRPLSESPLEYSLTPRELEVLHWVSQGKRDAEIGIIIGITRDTVSKHVQSIMRKLGAETRGAAAAMMRAQPPSSRDIS